MRTCLYSFLCRLAHDARHRYAEEGADQARLARADAQVALHTGSRQRARDEVPRQGPATGARRPGPADVALHRRQGRPPRRHGPARAHPPHSRHGAHLAETLRHEDLLAGIQVLIGQTVSHNSTLQALRFRVSGPGMCCARVLIVRERRLRRQNLIGSTQIVSEQTPRHRSHSMTLRF